MKPSYWVCGGGSQISCPKWNNKCGCWHERQDIFQCVTYNELNAQEEK